jgi:para-nitrobenzyl esterase
MPVRLLSAPECTPPFLLVTLIAVCLCSAQSVAAADDLIVTVGGGQLKGAPRALGGAEFLGIPYAQPPIGDLRWRDPVPAKPWTGIRDATTFGAPCAQPVLGDWNRRDAETSKEDCLFLNVMTPVWPAKAPLPVMVWFHGGANAGGTASSPLYKDGTLVQHGIVLVTVNYRLGIFGFFAHPALTKESPHHSSGNYGLLDQILALRWVRDNVAKFGGDSANITVFGQSAGAIDAGYLMVSPLGKGLFQRMIAQSGSPLGPPLPALSEAEQANEKLVASLKAPAGYELQYLRERSVQELLAISSKQDPAVPPSIGPIIDGWLIARPPAEVFNAGQEAPVDLVMGTTSREFGLLDPPDAVRKFIQNVTGNLSERAFALYGFANGATGKSDPLYGTAGDQWFADVLFRCPTTTEAQWHVAVHHSVYEYELQHAIPGQEAQGSVHSADLPYVFGYFPKRGNISGHFGDIDFKLADLIETYFTNFAKTGDPNSSGVPKWPQFDGSQAYIQFTQEGTVANSAELRRTYCDLYREVLKQQMNGPH